MKCQGECRQDDTCTGEVKFVSVTGGGFKGSFNFFYCDTAIQIDKDRGFMVEEQEF